MVTRMNHLPPFQWEFAADRDFEKADCSRKFQQIVHDLFHFSQREFAKRSGKTINFTPGFPIISGPITIYFLSN